MKKHPNELLPTAIETIQLIGGKEVQIPKATPKFRQWNGPAPGDDYGGKAIVEFAGQPLFPELAVLGAFEASGWSGVWVDSFGRRNRRAFWREESPVVLPPPVDTVLRKVGSFDSKARCWDVFCWLEERYIFAELKRRSRDRIRESQRRWLGAAFHAGFGTENFLIVEWDLDTTEAV